MAHAGSWFGLPDFGVTERLSDIFQGPQTRTSQGGSNLLPSASNIINPYPGNVLGTSSQNKTSSVSPVSPSVNQSFQNMSYANPNTLSSGGGGGGGGSLLDQWKSLGNTGDLPVGWNGPSGGGSSAEDLARQQAQAELESALTEYDRYSEEAQAQKSSLGTQRTQSLSELASGYGQAETQAKTSKEEAIGATAKAKNKALSTAEDVKNKNRNVLRALGILSSSAAGEMLGKPMEEYASQAAELEQGLIQRQATIDDWLKQRLTEFTQAKTSIEQQYAELVGNIDRDLRFNDKQRLQAVKAAQVAAQQAVQQAQAQAQAYQQAAQQYNAGILQQVAQLRTYQNPTADTSDIQNSLLSMASPQQSQTASIYQTDEQKKRLSGLGI